MKIKNVTKRISHRFHRVPWLFFIAAYIFLAGVILVEAYLNLNRFRLGNAAAQFSSEHLLFSLFIALCFVVLCYLIYVYIARVKRGRSFLDALIDNRYLIAASLLLFALVFSLNGYSLSCWDQYVNATYGNNIILGENRMITSDTWALSTPLIFNQVENGFPALNNDIMTHGAEAMLMGLPVADIYMIAKPFQWGFLLFGKSVGLAWSYYFKLFALLLSSYEICSYFIKSNKRIALLFALIITFAPALQWWFAQGIVDTVVSFQICLAALIVFIKYNNSNLYKAFAAVAMLVGGSSFVLALYPGLQVPLGYLFLILGITMIVQNRKSIRFRKLDAALLIGVVALVGVVCVRFYLMTSDGIELLGKTVFPGARMVTGGEYNPNELFYTFYQWLLPERMAAFSNNCEISFFVLFIPMIFFVFPLYLHKTKARGYLVLFLYTLFLISWLFIKYPAMFAKYTLFSNVSEHRLDIVIGLITVYLAAIAAEAFIEGKIVVKNLSAVVNATISAALCVAASLMLDAGSYLSVGFKKYGLLFIAMGIVWVSTYTFCRWNKKWFSVIALCVIFFAGVRVNPVCYGTGPIFQEALASKIETIEEHDSDAIWAVNGGFPYVNYLTAFGVRSINALNSYPDMAKWSVIDPVGTYEDCYNRFAHVSIQMTDAPSVMSNGTADTILLQLNAVDADKLGVKYILSKVDLSGLGYQSVYQDEKTGFCIFMDIEQQ